MSYELRTRTNNGVFANYYCSDDEGETAGNDNSNDPDYTRRQPSSRRRPPSRNPAQMPRQRRKLSATAASQNQCSTSGPAQPVADEKTLLSWLINKGGIREGETVKCQVNKGVAKEGLIRADGIICRCCSIVMTVSQFDVHAGSFAFRPFENIVVTRTKCSLLQHFTKIWNEGEKTRTKNYNTVGSKRGSRDSSDNVCQICADGGDLMCCEQCPSTFHLGCIKMQALPEDGWHCCYCKCKYCGAPFDYGNKMACVQCARAVHLKCLVTYEGLDLNNDAMCLYCSSTCNEVAKKVQDMVGIKYTIKDEYSWRLIRRMEVVEMEDDHKRMECNIKVALAYEVLSESFLTNIDNRTGINILKSVVNNTGSNLERVNFSGFYTIILEKHDAIISAATLRMHGREVAEMPYIATRNKYRLKGILRMILNAITSMLSYIRVKKLVIPAIEEIAEMWQRKHGFVPIDDEMKKKLIMYNTLMFPGTMRLQKTIAGTSSSAMELDHHSARLATLNLNYPP